MSAWPSPLAEQLRSALRGDLVWDGPLASVSETGPTPFGVHLAIFIEPYLDLILQGRKTIESRFAQRRCPPYGCVERNDVILLKRSGGPIIGLCQVADVWFHERKGGTWLAIREKYAEPLCALDPNFWRKCESASFATLVYLAHVRAIVPAISYTKRDRRGWVVLRRAEKRE